MPLKLKNFADAFEMFDDTGKMQPGEVLAKPAVMALVAASAVTYRSVPKAAEGMLEIAEGEAERRMEWRVRSELSSLVEGHTSIYGPRAAIREDNSQWDADLEESLEDYASGTIRDGIGEDGIGEAMNRLDLGMPEWFTELSKVFSRGAIAGLIRDKTPAKALSSLGIIKADLEKLVTVGAGTEEDKSPEINLSESLFAVVSALRDFATAMGATDAATLMEFMGGEEHIREQLWSDLPALQASALTGLGALDHAAAFAAVVKARVGYAEVIASVFSDDPVPAAEKPARRARARKGVTVGPWNEIASGLRHLLAGKDADKAAKLGISRSAFVNYATDKNGWEPSASEITAILEMLDAAGKATHALYSEAWNLGGGQAGQGNPDG